MPWWFVSLLAGPALLLPLAAYALFRHRVPGARWYGLLLIIIAWWSLMYAWELSARDLATKALALRIKYLAIESLPPAWIGFILAFVGSDPRRVRSRVIPLAVVGIGATVILWTDHRHGLFWGPMVVETVGHFAVLKGRGPGFWINVAYTYAVLAVGIVLLLVHTAHSPYLYKRRTAILMLGALVPWIGNLVFVLRRDESIFDPTPFLFTCTALIAALAVFRFDLFEPAPTLRDARIDFIGDPVIILDLRRRIADLNAAAQVVLGRRRAEAAGATIDDLLPGWPAGTLPDGPLDVSVRDDAGTRTFDLRCSPVQSLAGQPTGSVVSLRDVTDRRAMELALRESEGRYRAVIEQAFDAVWLTTREGTIVDVNPQACALLGVTREELIGGRASDRAPAIDTAVMAQDESALARGEAVSWECELPARGGSPLLVSGRTRQISPDLVVSTFRDITKERAHAAIRERLLSDAESANRLKDEFLATLSHELRTPLNAVLGWTQMLTRQGVNAEQTTHALEVIERNTMAQARLIDDLLDVSALTGGRARLLMRATTVQALVAEAAESVGPLAAARGVTLRVSAPADLPPIQADPDRLRQAVWNLLTNAIKFTGAGGQVGLGTRVTGRRLEITVTDTGSGIAPDFLPHVFEPFRQADSGSTRTSRGLGLGLTIVRRIVEAHGGHVDVESRGVGHGSTFRLWLPVQGASSRDGEQQVAPIENSNGAGLVS